MDETEAVPVAWAADGGTTLAEPETALDDPYPGTDEGTAAGPGTTGTGADPSAGVRTVGSEFFESSATSASLPARDPDPTGEAPMTPDPGDEVALELEEADAGVNRLTPLSLVPRSEDDGVPEPDRDNGSGAEAAGVAPSVLGVASTGASA